MQVTINHTAGWWLGDLSGPYVKAISDSIQAEWGVEPLWIREGGSIPGIPFLEQECRWCAVISIDFVNAAEVTDASKTIIVNVKAIHFPMGAASDSAHLPNERIKMVNLEVS